LGCLRPRPPASAEARPARASSARPQLEPSTDFDFCRDLRKKLDLIYNQLFRLTDCAREILDSANVAIAGSSLQLADLELNFREEAEEFWKMALLGIVADHDMPDDQFSTAHDA